MISPQQDASKHARKCPSTEQAHHKVCSHEIFRPVAREGGRALLFVAHDDGEHNDEELDMLRLQGYSDGLVLGHDRRWKIMRNVGFSVGLLLRAVRCRIRSIHLRADVTMCVGGSGAAADRTRYIPISFQMYITEACIISYVHRPDIQPAIYFLTDPGYPASQLPSQISNQLLDRQPASYLSKPAIQPAIQPATQAGCRPEIRASYPS